MTQNDELSKLFLEKLGALKADCLMVEAIPLTGINKEDLEQIEKALSNVDEVLQRHGISRGKHK